MEATAKTSIPPSCAIDLGTNSFRLLIDSPLRPASIPAIKKLITVRIGQDVVTTGQICPEAMERGLSALAEFRREMEIARPCFCRCCGTEALRRAQNSPLFIKKAEKILGCAVELIDGTQEAALTAAGVFASLCLPTGPAEIIIADVGGGSTEVIVLSRHGKIVQSASFSIGAVSLTEAEDGDMKTSALGIFRKDLNDFIDPLAKNKNQFTLIGSGGTATAMAALELKLETYDGTRVQGHGLTRSMIDLFHHRLSAIPPGSRSLLPGLEEGRGDIILAGMEIYQELLATIGGEGMIVSDAGLLEGILLSCPNQGRPLNFSF
ncbi:MAG: hypothetical protein KJ950_07130 [Proteobacteria bacterium]|nr:hypothetical protein [Pseudomonadota bacterium]MBU1687017.1 hypothetical protein [Pseudomonadota bacterium]